MAVPPYGVYGIPVTPHVRTGNMLSYHPSSGNYADIVSDLQRLPAKPPQFQARQFFYDVAYPYWQYPYHVGPYVQAQTHGFKRSIRQAGYVGAPLPASDYQFPATTVYNPRPY